MVREQWTEAYDELADTLGIGFAEAQRLVHELAAIWSEQTTEEGRARVTRIYLRASAREIRREPQVA